MDLDSYIKKIADRLYERIDEGVIVKYTKVSIGEWTPEENQCHLNVSIWCEHNENYTPVRGWLYFDLPFFYPYVLFKAHSVIRDENSVLLDITPSNASQPYPFIAAEESEREYGEFIEKYGVTEIKYYI